MPMQCPCCGGSRCAAFLRGLISVYSSKPYDLEKCPDCRHVVTAPKPSEAELADFYRQSYLYEVHYLIISEKKYRARSLARLIGKLTKDGGEARAVLEIGCMYGYLLEELKKIGCKPCGIELDKAAVQHCIGAGLEVHNTTVEAFLEGPERQFDVIVLSHVLEHLLNPREIVTGLKKLLTPNGVVVICVPDSGSLCAKVFGKSWGWWQVPIHINHFNRSSLPRLLETCDYQCKQIKHKGGDSMMLLLNWINLLGRQGMKKELSPWKRAFIRLFSSVFKHWFHVGNEELTVVASRG